MAQPLDGLLVLDFSTLLPGPMATLMLAEAGAEVIKIERPGSGDEMRSYEPKLGGSSVNFALLNRGKRSLALDLKSTADQAMLRPLLARADVLVEQFRPGVMDRLGLSYQAVAAVNPGIIYCSITGYGQTGPKRDRAGHDLNYQGDAGMPALSHGGPGRPVVPPALVADVAGGAYPAVMNILLALRERDRTGSGRYLDVSMAEGLFPFLYWSIGQGTSSGEWPGNGDSLVTGGSPRYRLYPTSDGRMLAAAPIEDRFWAVFCETIGLEAGFRDDRQDQDATAAAVSAIIAVQSAAHWREAFQTADCCCTIVALPEEAIRDPHFLERGVFAGRVDSGGASAVALPLPIDKAFRRPDDCQPLPAPELGEANGVLRMA